MQYRDQVLYSKLVGIACNVVRYAEDVDNAIDYATFDGDLRYLQDGREVEYAIELAENDHAEYKTAERSLKRLNKALAELDAVRAELYTLMEK